jgi:beta-glucosidase
MTTSRSLTLLTLLVPLCFAQPQPAYKNTSLEVEDRVKDLLGRMTLEEKVAQLESTWQNLDQALDPSKRFVDSKGQLDEAKARIVLKNGLGEFSRPSEGRSPSETVAFANRVQHIAVENTRLGIPLIFHEECLHGLAAADATSYPQAIGLAGTWDPELVRRIFEAMAVEVRARGAHQCLMPVVDLARDPRWGRTEETYGEDPYLTARMGVAAVKGLQGSGATIDSQHVLATLKHFAVHSQPESGTNIGPASYSERTVREYFLYPFEVAIKEAKVRTIMPSYNELDGIPNHSNNWLLRDVLRKEWGFSGLVVSDYFAVEQLASIHHVAENCAQAAKLAITAGVDVELPWGKCYDALPELVRKGEVPESLIDEAVSRVLRPKFELGLFEHPYVDPQRPLELSDSPSHRQLALQAARETITLLKNENRTLPLDLGRTRTIAVIGPNAAEAHLGGYSGKPKHAVSILEGIRNRVGEKGKVLYAEGCRITESLPDWNADRVVPADPALDEKRMAEAVKTLSQADVGIVVVGENEQTSREAWADNHLGDRDDLNLYGRQDELVRRLIATGKPVIVVLIHGRPNSVVYIAEHAKAILDGWYLGQEGGSAVAEVLFGDVNPAGRLPITIPRSVGQLPDYYYAKSSARRPYLFNSNAPLFPFGFGLSYSTFHYDRLRVSPVTIPANGTATVEVDITNTSDRAGGEVAQMYIRDEVSSVTRPIKELRGFERINLKPGETRTVRFQLGPKELEFFDRQMKRVVEPGKFRIMVGPNSVNLIETLLIVAQ